MRSSRLGERGALPKPLTVLMRGILFVLTALFAGLCLSSTALAAPKMIRTVKVGHRADPAPRGGVIVRNIVVRHDAGARVTLRCIPGCRRSNRRTAVTRGRRQSSFLRINLALSRFTKLEIAVERRGRIGRFAQFAPGRKRGTLRRARRGCMSRKQIVSCRTGRAIARREIGRAPTCSDCSGIDPLTATTPAPGSPSPAPAPVASPAPTPAPAPAETGNGWFQMVGSDLVFIKTRNTGSGKVEVHSATASSGYSAGQHSVTWFSSGDADNGAFHMVGPDLFFVKTANTGSGKVEVHSATSGSGYGSGQHNVTWFTPGDAGTGRFHMAGPDLFFVKTRNTGSGKVEVHSATSGSGYSSGQHSATWFSPADGGA